LNTFFSFFFLRFLTEILIDNKTGQWLISKHLFSNCSWDARDKMPSAILECLEKHWPNVRLHMREYSTTTRGYEREPSGLRTLSSPLLHTLTYHITQSHGSIVPIQPTLARLIPQLHGCRRLQSLTFYFPGSSHPMQLEREPIYHSTASQRSLRDSVPEYQEDDTRLPSSIEQLTISGSWPSQTPEYCKTYADMVDWSRITRLYLLSVCPNALLLALSGLVPNLQTLHLSRGQISRGVEDFMVNGLVQFLEGLNKIEEMKLTWDGATKRYIPESVVSRICQIGSELQYLYFDGYMITPAQLRMVNQQCRRLRHFHARGSGSDFG